MSERPVAIIGKGMIGISLAVLFTGNGIPTIVLAKTREVGLEKYRTYYRDLIAQGLVTEKQAAACEKLLSFTEHYAGLKDAEIVFECVTEKLEVKYEVYGQIEAYCPALKAIASTTSAISPADLAKGITQREKLMVAHPYNPPHMVPCVELVKNDFTDQGAIDAVTELLESCGREVCKMNRPAPGFIANRLQHALYREAVYMVEQGICGPEDIDKCIRSSWGPRYTSIGLFDHFDYAGLDLIANIESYLYPDLCDTKAVHPSLQERLDRGDLGYKTGVGYYDWRERDMDAFRKKISDPYLRFFNWKLPD
ncbi:3-hydroxyacyl-CoA dehydrogenase NAD-binding domain-containing protein [uncultured Oscillibacter sp.]|uniref:3-hydroxyacyl-CoA dehydrogenase family protein n=1 Tax=uncultured Oscillibacter sp. TaxID=876091 RepID=UPI0025F85278|nr:3-hydroxyacyl-CoA dehydrogenase NAD-binding domain-containing protein [uncultured Oscillibacter sp.]